MLHTAFRAAIAAAALAVAPLAAVPAFAHEAHTAVTLGSIEISGAFSRATLPNAPVAGGFLTLTNAGSTDDRLVSASAPIAADTQIHEMAMEGDVMRMRKLPDGLPIPAGQTVVLEPGGFHLMFMGLTGSLSEGETVPVTLVFEHAGTITVDLAVGAAAADAPAHGEGHH